MEIQKRGLESEFHGRYGDMQLRVDSSCDLFCGVSDCRMDLTCSKEFTDVLDDVLFIRQMKAWNILELTLFQTKRAICKCVFSQ